MKIWKAKLRAEKARLRELAGELSVARANADQDLEDLWSLFREFLVRLGRAEGLAARIDRFPVRTAKRVAHREPKDAEQIYDPPEKLRSLSTDLEESELPTLRSPLTAVTKLLRGIEVRHDLGASIGSHWDEFFRAPSPGEGPEEVFVGLADLWDREILLRWWGELVRSHKRPLWVEGLSSRVPTEDPDPIPWLTELSRGSMDRLLEMTRNYVRAWLLLSTAGVVPESFSWIRHRMGETAMKDAVQHTEDILRQGELSRDVGEVALAAVRRVSSIVSEGGYDTLMDILHGAGAGTGSMPDVPPSVLRILPTLAGHDPGEPLVLATARGQRGRYSQTRVLKELTTHLIACRGTVQVVFFITDGWDSSFFANEHLPNWKEFASQGIVFIVFLAGPALWGMSPVEIALPPPQSGGGAGPLEPFPFTMPRRDLVPG